MIDMLVLRCDFTRIMCPISASGFSWPKFQLIDLELPLEMSINREGIPFRTRHPWESIPSSYESMAFHVFDNRWDKLDQFYVEIKASPAKIMQGHNIFGSNDIYDCSLHLIDLLKTTYPRLFNLLDPETWRLAQIDITYSVRAKDQHECKEFINALHSVSFGQTKSRTGYDGTAYFGKKNSRLKKIKVYSKLMETLETIKRNSRRDDGELLNEVYTQEIIDYSNSLIRWEVSLYHRFFERLGISTQLKEIFTNHTFTPAKLQNYWKLGTQDLFKSLAGQTMKSLNTIEIKNLLREKFKKVSDKTGKTSYVLADSVFRTYNDLIRDGWLTTSESMSRMNFHRHVKMLQEIGLSRAALQNLKGTDGGAVIIPFARFIEVDFCSQYPEGYIQPPPKYKQPNHLRLVA